MNPQTGASTGVMMRHWSDQFMWLQNFVSISIFTRFGWGFFCFVFVFSFFFFATAHCLPPIYHDFVFFFKYSYTQNTVAWQPKGRSIPTIAIFTHSCERVAVGCRMQRGGPPLCRAGGPALQQQTLSCRLWEVQVMVIAVAMQLRKNRSEGRYWQTDGMVFSSLGAPSAA